MIAESQAFRRQVLWFTTLVSRGENLPPLYRALTEAGAVKVVKKRWPKGKSKAALLPGPLWMTTSVAVLSPVNAKSSVRAAAENQATGRQRGRAEPDTFVPAREHWPDQNAFSPGYQGQNAPSTA